MKQEKAFFETLTGALSPGWMVKLQSQLQPGRMDLGRYQVRLYLIDTSNGWTAAAAMAPDGFDEARCNVAAAKLTPTAVRCTDRLPDLQGCAAGSTGRALAVPGLPGP